MKSARYFLLLLLSFICLSCEKSKYNPESGGYYAVGPTYCLTIVKFLNNEHANKVILQNPIKEYNSIDGLYEYFENSDLYLNIALRNDLNSYCGLGISLVNWADEQMQISGSSPYIPLTDGYYLVDWKWHQLHPISSRIQSRPKNFNNHFSKHCFLTDIDWQDVQNLTDGYSSSLYTQNVYGLVEIIRVYLTELDRYYNDVKRIHPYSCYGGIYYNDGMCFEDAWMYYEYGDCSHSGKTHLTYIAYCDSLQTVYQQRLIELIDNGKLKDFIHE